MRNVLDEVNRNFGNLSVSCVDFDKNATIADSISQKIDIFAVNKNIRRKVQKWLNNL